MFNENIDKQYLVLVDGTSDGTQDKYYKNNFWYKTDFFGGEGYAEYLASLLLQCSNLKPERYITYEQGLINSQLGCRSENFLKPNEEFITIYRLYKMQTGRNIGEDLLTYNIQERANFVLKFMYEQTKLDLREYFANTLALDKLILNEDRHFNNLGVVFTGEKFIPAPIFDNGKSMFVGNYSINRRLSLEENIKRTSSKPFSGDFDKNFGLFAEYCSIRFDERKIEKLLEKEPASEKKDIILHQIHTVKEKEQIMINKYDTNDNYDELEL